VRLPNDTRIILAPRTTVVLDGQRTVTLTGQAYFDVVSSTDAPFTVRTGNVETHVLGTTFDITRYAHDPAVCVAVVSGRVQSRVVSAIHGASMIVTAGMVARFTDSTAATLSRDASEQTSWTKGRLDFRGTPAPEFLSTLERWYGMRFRIADSSLAQAKLSGHFVVGSSAAALDAVKTLLGASMTFDRLGDTTFVTLHARRTSDKQSPPRRDLGPFLETSQEIGR
jgi:transmembrane sensor